MVGGDHSFYPLGGQKLCIKKKNASTRNLDECNNDKAKKTQRVLATTCTPENAEAKLGKWQQTPGLESYYHEKRGLRRKKGRKGAKRHAGFPCD